MALRFKYEVARLLFEAASLFVPRRRYQRRLQQIIDQDEKNEGVDLQGWSFHKVPRSDGAGVHRYYHFPSRRPDAPAILFLHGLNLDGRNFLGMKPLADAFELYAYDFPEADEGFTGDVDDFTPMLDDFRAVIGREAVHLVGVSFGGMVALRYTGTHPAAPVSSLVMISSQIPGYREADLDQTRAMDDLVRGAPDDKLYWLLERLRRRHLRHLSSGQRRQFAPLIRPKKIDWYRQVTASIREYRGGDDAARVRCPAMLVLGTEDQLVALESVVDFREAIGHGRVEILDGAVHDVSLTHPERVVERLQSFYTDPTVEW